MNLPENLDKLWIFEGVWGIIGYVTCELDHASFPTGEQDDGDDVRFTDAGGINGSG